MLCVNPVLRFHRRELEWKWYDSKIERNSLGKYSFFLCIRDVKMFNAGQFIVYFREGFSRFLPPTPPLSWKSSAVLYLFINIRRAFEGSISFFFFLLDTWNLVVVFFMWSTSIPEVCCWDQSKTNLKYSVLCYDTFYFNWFYSKCYMAKGEYPCLQCKI